MPARIDGAAGTVADIVYVQLPDDGQDCNSSSFCFISVGSSFPLTCSAHKVLLSIHFIYDNKIKKSHVRSMQKPNVPQFM